MAEVLAKEEKYINDEKALYLNGEALPHEKKKDRTRKREIEVPGVRESE